MTALRADYETAVVAAITAAQLDVDLGGPAGGYLRLVAAYNGPLAPDEDSPALLRLLENGTPSIGVTTGDGEYADIALRRRMSTLETTLELLVCSANLRSHEAQLRGDGIASDPGIYQIIEDLRAVLFGEELGVDGVGYANPAAEQAIIRAEHMTVWRLSYAVRMDANRPAITGDDYASARTDVNQAGDDTADPITRSDRIFGS